MELSFVWEMISPVIAPIWSDHGLSAEAEALAREIAGVGASPRRLELARTIAETQIEISRVSQAKRNLLERSLSNADYDLPKDAYERNSDLIRLDKCLHRSRGILPMVQSGVLEPAQGPKKFALIISDLSLQLAAMARYERRALSRRKFAIRAFDKAARELVRPSQTVASGLVMGAGSTSATVI